MLKWWWRFHAAILPSWGAPRSTRAAPAGPTPSRGSSVLSALQLCHTLITQKTGITHSHTKRRHTRRRCHRRRSAAHMPCTSAPRTYAHAGKQARSKRHRAVIHLWRSWRAPHCRQTVAESASRNRLTPKHSPVSRVRRVRCTYWNPLPKSTLHTVSNNKFAIDYYH